MDSLFRRQKGLVVLVGLLLALSTLIFLAFREGSTNAKEQMKQMTEWAQHVDRLQHDVTVLKIKVATLERREELRPVIMEENGKSSQDNNEEADREFVAERGSQTRKTSQSEVQTDLEGKKSYMVYRDEKRWHDDSASCNYSEVFDVAQMKTPVGSIRMHVHHPEDDVFISKRLLRSGRWEGTLVKSVLQCLMADEDLGLLDIGANVGVYTLIAAKLGRRVVALEPFPSNVKRLCRSLEDNRLQSHVTLVRNALSDSRQLVTFKLRKGSVGHTAVKKAKATLASGNVAQAILLDDVIDLLKGVKGVVIKMDVEGHEAQVLLGGKKFFREIPVSCMLMEWGIVKKSASGSLQVRAHMAENHFLPFDPENTSAPLPLDNVLTWPDNVLWLRQGPTSNS